MVTSTQAAYSCPPGPGEVPGLPVHPRPEPTMMVLRGCQAGAPPDSWAADGTATWHPEQAAGPGTMQGARDGGRQLHRGDRRHRHRRQPALLLVLRRHPHLIRRPDRTAGRRLRLLRHDPLQPRHRKRRRRTVTATGPAGQQAGPNHPARHACPHRTLAKRRSEPRPRRMTEAEIKAIMDKLADIARVLHDADPK